MARVTTLRIHLHGDEHERDAGTYLCRVCDLFRPSSHFDSPHGHSANNSRPHSHVEIYNEHRREFLTNMRRGKYIPGAYRPEAAPNCVVAPAQSSMVTP